MTLGNNETTPMLPRRQSSNHWNKLKQKTMFLRTVLALGLLSGLVLGVWALQSRTNSNTRWEEALVELEQESACARQVDRVPGTEFIQRQARLFKTMESEDVFAYIMEPSASMVYYANLTWSRTERPFLLVFIDNKMTIVTPGFEATRAHEQWTKANLDIDAKMVSWKEQGSAFDTVKAVLESHHGYDSNSKIQIEPSTRYFIAQGIQSALHTNNVQLASPAIQHLRQVKTPAEIAIMTCANQITLRAIHTVQHHGIFVGQSEHDIETRMLQALDRVGLTNTWVVALVDENAAFPHGQPGESRSVKSSSLVLIDTGGELLDYQSDTTRTFFMDPTKVDGNIRKAWLAVHAAQQAVLDQTKSGYKCSNVDLVARQVITDAGWADAFTHRLGHGIGLEMHEDPYMNQGNTHCTLTPGNTFSVEPGIYVPGEFGIRLEDIVVVNDDGDLELLTDGLALDPWV